jgi:uncharacterized protein YegP (UPF0339 family)
MRDSDTRLHFETHRGADGHWRWRLVTEDDEILAKSYPGFTSRAEVLEGLQRVKANALHAPVIPPDVSTNS